MTIFRVNMSPSLVTDLRNLLDRDRVISNPTQLIVYECDGLVLNRRLPDVVVYPQSTEEVARIVTLCSRHSAPVVPRGAGTGLSGGAVAANGGVIMEMSRMNRILEIDYEDEIAVVQPGVVNLDLSKATSRQGFHFAPDPSSQKACTIGGNVAENAGGPHTLKYGITTNHVLGLKMVMPDGEITDFGGRLRDSAGYDLTGLVVGSEGTLGIVTEITVKLTLDPPAVETFLVTFDNVEDAGSTVSSIIAAGIVPAALEFIDNLVIRAVESYLKAGFPTDAAAVLLIEIDGERTVLEDEARTIESICEEHGGHGFQRAKSDEERATLWRGRKEAIGALGKVTPAFYTNDGVVPRSRLPEILKIDEDIGSRYGLKVAHVCHAGDGNIHPIILYDPKNEKEVKAAVKISESILKACVEMGGSLTGEHGIGMEKMATFGLMFSKEDQDQMIRVRRAFDTRGLMNPGKIFPSPSGCRETQIKATISGGGWL